MENKILIDSVNNLKVALNEISVYDFDVYTSMELYYKIAENFNKVIKELNRFEGVVSDEIIKQNEKLLYLLGEGLKIEVVDKINEMVETGVFDTIINLNIFNNLKEDIKNVSSQLDKKANKNEVFTMANMGQDIKEAMTGGSVAVVGKNSVLEDNIVNKQVTPKKTSFINHIETEQLIDVMPTVLSQKGDYYSPDDGKLYNTNGTQGFKNTGKIYIKSSKYLSKGISYIIFYDINDNFISAVKITGDDNLINNVQEINPPKNAYYMICDIVTIFWWDKDNTGQIYESFLYEVRDAYKYEKSLVTNENLILTDSYFLPIQIYNKNNLTNGIYNLETGIIESDSTGQYKCTPLQDCHDVDYKFYGVRDILYFDEKKKYTGKYKSHSTDELMASFQIVRPIRGAKYMAFNIPKYYWERSEVFQLKDKNKVCELKNTFIENKLNSLNRYSGKTIINFGDSIFGNFESPSDISSIISHNLNCNAINMGFGGSRISSHLQDENFDKFSFYNLVNSIVSNDFTLQENALTVSGIPSYYKYRIATLKTIDWGKVEVITIAYGTNDWNGANLIENRDNLQDTNTYKGAFRYSLEKLLTKYPHLKIFICTPIYRFKEDLSMDSDGEWTDATTGQKLPQFVQACKDIGKEYKLKVIDNYYELGINKLNRLYYFNSVDGTHPNYNGRKLIADNISKNI